MSEELFEKIIGEIREFILKYQIQQQNAKLSKVLKKYKLRDRYAARTEDNAAELLR